jgi:hypothetical protein
MLFVGRGGLNGNWAATEGIHVRHFLVESFRQRPGLNGRQALLQLLADANSNDGMRQIAGIQNPV